ncbi:MAG TPA: hypothetical protein VLB76_01810 [Thermoanaerobaculia bacterium]|jgi:hypothetical protein|nr:hypothetical protein [Thermoanaerobaculia bacterium]
MADLTISNPQPFVVTVALDRGDGLETRDLAYNAVWTVPAATDRQIWIAFFLLESGELLAEAELPAGTASAQLLLEQPYDILLRADVNAPLTIANELDIPIRVDVLPVGEAEVQSRDLAAAGDVGSTWAMPALEHGQWIGFYSEDDEYIGANLDGSTEIETITLKHPGAAYVIGDPYPTGTPIVTRSFVREPQA